MSRRGIQRAVRRVRNNQRATVENKMFYQSGREWTQFHDDGMVNRRRANVAASVGEPAFVPGIVHVPEAHGVDGLDAGKTCSCFEEEVR